MLFTVKTGQFWMLWARGMVVYPFILFGARYPDEEIFKHELMHAYQIKKYGVFKFYMNYILLLLRYGYKNHPYELEAKEYQKQPLTPIEKVWYNGSDIDLDNQWLP